MKLSYSLITVIINKAKVGHILSDTIINSCTNIYSVKARGSLIREEWYQKLLPNMHPELEILQFITPHKNTSFVMDTIIQKGEFKRYGSGAIFCQTCDDIYFSSDVKDPQIALNESPSNLSLKKDLVGIFCIVQKDKADPIVRHIIEQGSPSPTITFGRGHGIRDSLGLLRIAINPEKEFMFIVVDNIDARPLFDTIIEKGRLFVPGEGFIYMLPVEKGLVNLRATYSNSNQSASVKQIVKAIDELKGSTDWRSKDSSKKDLSINSKRKHLEHLTRVTCILPRGSEDRLISVILDNGAPGASVFYGNECGNQAKELNQGIQLTNEKAIIEMILSNDIVQPIIEKIKHESDQHKLPNTVIYTHTVDRAFTYIGD